MEDAAETGQGAISSLRRVLKTVRAVVENRLELLLVEFHEARWRFIYALLLAGVVLLLALMTLLVPTIAIVVLCVSEKRLDLVAALTLLYLAAAFGFFWHLRSWLKEWAPFSATVAELKKDKACLDEKS